MNKAPTLRKLYEKIKTIDLPNVEYWIPSVWQDSNETYGYSVVNPKKFFLNSLDKILENESPITSTKENPLVYCMMLRYTTCVDHNRDNIIAIEPIHNSFYETGTLLKSISILPYIKSLGVDSIYLLPVNEIGKFGRKGIPGSPYAYKHPYKLDPRLGEPFLDFPIEEHFKAFVEACHYLGIKVVLEFVLRTASIDCELALEHPEWFYWLKEEYILNGTYAPPVFTKEELEIINGKVEANDFENLIPPSKEYQSMFTTTPSKVYKEGEKIVGVLEDGTRVTIPSAFADWPPNDIQPLWTDVTYLKLYSHEDFNYIAYNTVRMYSRELVENGKKVEDLWNFLSEIIPTYIAKYDIDGAMIDMGHALPPELLSNIITKAREIKKDFIFWEENFSVSEKAKSQGYNATLGFMFFDQAEPIKLKEIITKLANHEFKLPFFLSPENHNTPRAARISPTFNKLCYVFNSFLPGIRYILSGFEWLHTTPYNTGLCFEEDEICNFPPESLPLFSPIEFIWGSDNIIRTIQEVNSLSENFGITNEAFDEYKLKSIEISNDNIVAYSRTIQNSEIIVFGNFSPNEQKYSDDNVNSFLRNSEILLGEFCLNSQNQIILQPFGFLVLKRVTQ
jgi:glycosidase